MANIGSYSVGLIVDTKNFAKGIKQAQDIARNAQRQMQNEAKKIGNLGDLIGGGRGKPGSKSRPGLGAFVKPSETKKAVSNLKKVTDQTKSLGNNMRNAARGGSRLNGILFQASFAAQDAASQFGTRGLSGALMASVNNFQQMGSLLAGPAGIAVSLGAAAVAALAGSGAFEKMGKAIERWAFARQLRELDAIHRQAAAARHQVELLGRLQTRAEDFSDALDRTLRDREIEITIKGMDFGGLRGSIEEAVKEIRKADADLQADRAKKRDEADAVTQRELIDKRAGLRKGLDRFRGVKPGTAEFEERQEVLRKQIARTKGRIGTGGGRAAMPGVGAGAGSGGGETDADIRRKAKALEKELEASKELVRTQKALEEIEQKRIANAGALKRSETEKAAKNALDDFRKIDAEVQKRAGELIGIGKKVLEEQGKTAQQKLDDFNKANKTSPEKMVNEANELIAKSKLMTGTILGPVQMDPKLAKARREQDEVLKNAAAEDRERAEHLIARHDLRNAPNRWVDSADAGVQKILDAFYKVRAQERETPPSQEAVNATAMLARLERLAHLRDERDKLFYASTPGTAEQAKAIAAEVRMGNKGALNDASDTIKKMVDVINATEKAALAVPERFRTAAGLEQGISESTLAAAEGGSGKAELLKEAGEKMRKAEAQKAERERLEAAARREAEILKQASGLGSIDSMLQSTAASFDIEGRGDQLVEELGKRLKIEEELTKIAGKQASLRAKFVEAQGRNDEGAMATFAGQIAGLKSQTENLLLGAVKDSAERSQGLTDVRSSDVLSSVELMREVNDAMLQSQVQKDPVLEQSIKNTKDIVDAIKTAAKDNQNNIGNQGILKAAI